MDEVLLENFFASCFVWQKYQWSCISPKNIVNVASKKNGCWEGSLDGEKEGWCGGSADKNANCVGPTTSICPRGPT